MRKNSSVIKQVLKNNPGMAFTLLQAFTDAYRARIFDYNFGSGKSSRIPLITFKITPMCNLNCLMCGQNGIHGTLKDKAGEEMKKIVPIERYMKLTDEVEGKTKVFYIWGGEPFLYPDFMDLAGYMSKKNLFTINTNGTFLADHARRIVLDRWAAIFISLDGFEDINDSIRGKGTYERVMEGIHAVNKEKKQQNSILPYVGIVTTISNMNYMYLDKLATAMSNKGLSWHIINLGTYTTNEIGSVHSKWVKKKLGIEPKYWKGFTSGFNDGIDGEKFSKILAKVHSIDNGYPIITVPVIRHEKIGIYYSELEELVRYKCMAPWFSVNINYNGEVYFCADYPDFSIGNIMDSGLLQIYNDKKAVKYRNALKNSPNGLFPACNRCYQLMLCGRPWPGFA